VPASRRALRRRRWLHRGGNPRRAVDRPCARPRGRSRSSRAADAVRRAHPAAARSRPPRRACPLRRAVRSGLVPLPDAAPGRAPGEPTVLPQDRAERVRRALVPLAVVLLVVGCGASRKVTGSVPPTLVATSAD